MANLLTPRSNITELYSDIPNGFGFSLINGDLTKVTNEFAVKQAIKNLLLTDRGERLFQHNSGSDIRALLFENATPATFKIMEDHIRDLIKLKEPRCKIIDLTISSVLDSNQVEITFKYTIINRTEVQTFSVFLDRVR